jgi:hypothetical protein
LITLQSHETEFVILERLSVKFGTGGNLIMDRTKIVFLMVEEHNPELYHEDCFSGSRNTASRGDCRGLSEGPTFKEHSVLDESYNWGKVGVSVVLFPTRSCYVAQAGLKLTILLSQPLSAEITGANHRA